MSNLPTQTSPVYCFDEDIAVRAGDDFAILVPPYQTMAAGTDGVFASGSPWVLTSATVNFASNGVAPNQVVQLTAPKANFPGRATLLAIDSVSGSTITLRRLHKDNGVGQPPAPSAGLSAVTFAVNTLDPQIEEASYDLKRRFAIDDMTGSSLNRTSAWMYDRRELRVATVLTVLLQRYVAEARVERGDFAAKVQRVRQELDDVLGRIQVRWGPFGNSAEPATIFGCKLSR